MANRALYSPTVHYSYKLDQDWWYRLHYNSEYTSNYDCQGYDQYGYDKNGLDRAYFTKEDYELSEETYVEVLEDYDFLLRINGM